uniref:NAC domain-containing protein n=1 Tax=Fagus sylvatica TaxID=28930 RepID=A0A2N9J7G1_FAGSY
MTSMPVGYRFHPTDEELINHYLRLKMLGKDSQVQDIAEVNVCNWEPWQLPDLSVIKSDDLEWFFFCRRNLKYSRSSRSNRATVTGYWKATGKDRKIKTKGTNKVIGTKKTLVFYTGRVPNGNRTNWVMHEYHPEPATLPDHQNAFVICRVKRKIDEKTNVVTCDEGDVSSYPASDFENQVPGDTIPEVFNQQEADPQSLFQHPQQDNDLPYSLQLQFAEYNRQEPSFGDSIFTFGLNEMQFQSDANEQEGDDFVSSLFVSSDTDTDTAQVAYDHFQASSSLFNDQVGPTEYRQMRMVNNGTVCQYKEERNVFISDDIFGLDTSSVDSAADYPRGSSESPQSIRTTKPQHQQRSRAAPRKFQPKIEQPKMHQDTVITIDLPKKEKPKVPAKELKLDVGTSQGQCPYPEKIPKPEKDVSTGSDRKGYLIFQETSLRGHESSPPSEYFSKTLMGIVLFVVIIWEVLIYGNWG